MSPRGGTIGYDVDAVGCFLKVGDEFLIILRSKDEEEPGTWGLPGGLTTDPQDPKGSILHTVKRETGVELRHEHVRVIDDAVYDEGSYTSRYRVYLAELEEKPPIRLNEHDAHRWTTAEG